VDRLSTLAGRLGLAGTYYLWGVVKEDRMKKILTLALLSVFVWSFGGCSAIGEAMVQKSLNGTEIAKAYYDQGKDGRTYNPVILEAAPGETMEITIKGLAKVALTTPHQPLSIYPRDPSTLSQLTDGLWKVGTVVGSTLVGLELVDGLSASPKVVEPTVVTVPR